MPSDGAKYVDSLLARSWPEPEVLAVRMAQAFLRKELQVDLDGPKLTISRQDDDAYYVTPTNPADVPDIDELEVRVVKDGSSVERV